MAGLLGQNAHLVSYGAMSKQPLSLSTSSFIFKNLTCHGFWQSRWYLERSRAEREKMMEDIAGLIRNGQVCCDIRSGEDSCSYGTAVARARVCDRHAGRQ
jgi:mitochondrial enoyl-[acyl-carrier protein] reductase / trans-2-enoyl-CoA reductase